MTRKQRRLTLIGLSGTVLAVAAGLALYGLTDRITFFSTPSDIAAKSIAPGERIRLGGLVKDGSVVKTEGGNVRFVVTDGTATVAVAYQGILPDLFREGQGVVAEGVIAPDRSLVADTILAKHDERYMPREVVDAMKKQGVWQETTAPK